MGRAEQISQLNEAVEEKRPQFMLILKPLFCYSEGAAEENQMTVIVKSDEDKFSVHICSGKLPCNSTI